MPKFKVTVWEQSVITYEVEADDEDKATDLINENICAYTPINEDIQDWDIEDVEEIE
jgi:hypothetical protein